MTQKFLSSIQYATGWLLIVLFGYIMVLPIFVGSLPPFPGIFSALILTFFTHATLGVRSTTLRYSLRKPWLDWAFLLAWVGLCLAFLLK